MNMEIQYLNNLKNNPINYGVLMDFEIDGINLEEIQILEQKWNNGNPFPKALKELLFLAGNYCYVCDYGVNENQQELQESVRKDLLENGKTIIRPFYAIDVYTFYNFLFIYLDEGDNPSIYHASPGIENNWIKSLFNNLTIKDLIDNRIERAKKGENPF